MAVTNYFSVGGQVRSEKGANGYLYYARDNLGSVSSTHDTSGAVYNTYSYNPYGGVSKGTGPFYINRRFLWCGSWGYSYINKTAQWLSYYVRARHYSALQGMWNTRDPLWPTEAANRYGNSSPASSVDPLGLLPCQDKDSGTGKYLADALCAKSQSVPAVRAAEAFCDKYKLQEKDSHGTVMKAPDGTLCNAMQHCMWACLIAQNCLAQGNGKATAKNFTDMHEEDAPAWWPTAPGYRPLPTPYVPNPPTHKCMDLYNNRIGINCSDASDCYSCCEMHIKSGDVQVVWTQTKAPKHWRSPRTDCVRNPKNVKFPVVDVKPPSWFDIWFG